MQALSKTAYNCALEMLARREHSYWELTKKLAQQYQADDTIFQSLWFLSQFP
jgi:SOS response regulatory protein OraA/RecX